MMVIHSLLASCGYSPVFVRRILLLQIVLCRVGLVRRHTRRRRRCRRCACIGGFCRFGCRVDLLSGVVSSLKFECAHVRTCWVNKRRRIVKTSCPSSCYACTLCTRSRSGQDHRVVGCKYGSATTRSDLGSIRSRSSVCMCTI